jgi:hypothetical protein
MTPKVRRLLEQLVGAALALGFDTAIAVATQVEHAHADLAGARGDDHEGLQVNGWELAARRDDGPGGKVLGYQFLVEAALEGEDGDEYAAEIEKLFGFWSRGEERVLEMLGAPRHSSLEDGVLELLGPELAAVVDARGGVQVVPNPRPAHPQSDVQWIFETGGS